MTTILNDRYRILKTIAIGGFSETFLAEDIHLPSVPRCVIKQLKPPVDFPEAQHLILERFQREATILEDLGKANQQIPELFAYFTENTKFYLVQQWIKGQTLTQKYQKEGNLSESQVVDILVNLLPVLEFVHDKRIIHRDIKPDNIIIRDSDKKPVLIDFGAVKEAVATVVNVYTTLSCSIVIGTPGYMSSEQAAGRPVCSSDLYSLGLTAVYLLCGKSPTGIEIDQRTGELMWQKEVPNISLNLSTVLDNVIKFHPKDRYANAQEMLQVLLNLQETDLQPVHSVSSDERTEQEKPDDGIGFQPPPPYPDAPEMPQVVHSQETDLQPVQQVSADKRTKQAKPIPEKINGEKKPLGKSIQLLLGGIVVVSCVFFLVLFMVNTNKLKSENKERENSTSVTTDWSNYQNSDKKIEIKHLSHWQLQEQSSATTGAIAKFISPNKTSNTFGQEVLILVQHLGNPISLKEYTELSVKEITKNNNSINGTLQPNSATLANRPAQKVIYESKQGTYEVKIQEVWTLYNNKAYVVTYISDKQDFDSFLPVVNDMINSFKIQEFK